MDRVKVKVIECSCLMHLQKDLNDAAICQYRLSQNIGNIIPYKAEVNRTFAKTSQEQWKVKIATNRTC